MNFQDLLIVIPAKLGSERVERKNLQPCGGMTLLERAVRFALPFAEQGCTLTVTTESAECAAVAGNLGVPHIVCAMPPQYHGPTSYAGDVWGHAWRTLEEIHGREFGFSLYLEPTCPQREIAHVVMAMSALGAYHAAMTVEPVPEKYWSQRQWGLDGRALAETRDTVPVLPRQGRAPRYVQNGAAYARRRPGYWMHTTQPHVRIFEPGSTYAVITQPLINIDTWDDLREADRALSGNKPITEGGDLHGEVEGQQGRQGQTETVLSS